MSSVLMAKLWSLYIAAPWPFMVALERMVSAPPAKVRRRLRVMPINSLAGSETKFCSYAPLIRTDRLPDLS